MSIAFHDCAFELKKNMFENNFRAISEENEIFSFAHEDDLSGPVSLRLILSEQVDTARHRSRNNNPLAGIGVFSFRLPEADALPDYFILAFENLISQAPEFVVVSNTGFTKRVKERKLLTDNSVYMRLWMMDDRCVYETTGIGMEGEWYFLGKGINGRMADNTVTDYTGNLNAWHTIR